MRKFLKISGYILGSIFVLLILIIAIIQTPWGQNQVRKQIVSFLEKKLNTPVAIGGLSYRLPNHIEINDLYLADRQKDTLVYLHQLELNWSAQNLLWKEIAVREITLDGLNAHIYRPSTDTNFNYQFIIDAFAGGAADSADLAETTNDTASSSFKYDVQKVHLSNIRIRYDDTAGGTLFSVRLGKAFIRPTLLDISQNKYNLNELELADVYTSFNTDTSYLPPPPPDTSEPSDFQIAVKKILLSNIHFSMLSQTDSMFFGANAGKIQAELKQFGLLNEQIKAGNLTLENVNSKFVFGKPQNNPVPTEENQNDTTSNNWKIWADGLNLNDIGFILNDPNTPRQKSGMDYSHMNFQQVFLKADNTYYSADSISANLKHLALREQCGLNLLDFRTNATYTNQGATLNDFYLQTPNSIMQDYLSIHYPSLDAMSNQMNLARLKVRLNESKIGVNDVLLFLSPEQQEQLLPYKNQHVNIVASLQGNMDKIQLKKLYLKGLKGTVVNINGQLNGLPDADKLTYLLNIKQLQTTQEDISPFLTDSLKQQFLLPDQMAITGKVKGSLLDYYPDLQIKTSDGDALIVGKLLMSPGTDKEEYELSIQTQNLNLGKLLRQDSLMGPVSATINANGVSFNPKKMNSRIGLNLHSAWLMGYDYQNILLNAHVREQKAAIEGSSTDPNIAFNLAGTVNLQNEYPSATLDLDLKNADLNVLQLTEDTISLAGKIVADFASLNPDYPDGTFSWSHPFINYNGEKLYPDSISIVSKPDAESNQNLTINLANLLQAKGSGHMPLTKLGEAISTHINRHYFLSDSLQKADSGNYDFAFAGNLIYQPILKQLIPDLNSFDTIPFQSDLNRDTFGLALNSSGIIYGENNLDSISFKINENRERMRYRLSLKKAETPVAALWYPYVGGVIRNDSIYVVVNIDDSLQKKQFTLGGAYYQNRAEDSSMNYFTLFKGMRFNYDIWSVNPENKIAFGADGFYIQGLNIAHDSQSISLNSETPAVNSPLNISIRGFSLANITQMFSKDTLLADGTLNATAKVDLSDSTMPKIDASVYVNNLKAFNYPLGNLSSKIENKDNQTFSTFLSLQGEGNNVQVYGDYYLQPVNNNDFDLTLLIKPLTLESVQGLTFGALKNSSGSINGELAIKGTMDKPLITGSLHTNELATNVAMLNAYFKMPKETIEFEPRRIIFNDFHIEDRNGHPATLEGKVFTTNFTDYFLNINFTAQRWQALHSQKKDNPEYYGDLVFSTNLNIKGSATAPKIEGNIVLHDSTDLNYALIDEGPGIVASEGIVAFVDSRDTTPVVKDSTEKRRRFYLSPSTELNVNVDVDKDATFTVLVDPATGDELQINGEAALNAYMDPSGAIGLTGTYQVHKGYYELNYNFLHRKFEIQDGSTVTLAGDPLEAEAEITAVYNTQVAPYDLVENVASEDQLVYFKQRLPFQVVLKMKGKVMKPEIGFDIVLPDDKTNVVSTNVSNLVQAKLTEIRSNPSELNKQVFAVLILNKFLADDPFSSGNGVDVEYAARKSVSRFLSDQLNQIAGHLVKGLELNFDLNSSEDYSTGTKSNQTNLNITASKSLFNDRLKVTVGNDFLLEGENAPRQQSSLIPGNLSVAYLLTKDGRYQASAYRTNELQDIVNGYVIETGIKFKVTLTYNKFKSLFINRRKYFAELRARRAKERATARGGETSKEEQGKEKEEETED